MDIKLVPVFLCLLASQLLIGQIDPKAQDILDLADKISDLPRSVSLFDYTTDHGEQLRVYVDYHDKDGSLLRLSVSKAGAEYAAWEKTFVFDQTSGLTILYQDIMYLDVDLNSVRTNYFLKDGSLFYYTTDGTDDKGNEFSNQGEIFEFEGDGFYIHARKYAEELIAKSVPLDKQIKLSDFKAGKDGMIYGTEPVMSVTSKFNRTRYRYQPGIDVEYFDDSESPGLKIISGHFEGMQDRWEYEFEGDWAYAGRLGMYIFLTTFGVAETNNLIIMHATNPADFGQFNFTYREILVRGNEVFVLVPVDEEKGNSVWPQPDCSGVDPSHSPVIYEVMHLDLKTQKRTHTNQFFCLGEM
jgi:hypothetical protein